MQTVMKTGVDIVAFNCAAMAAMMRSGQIWAAGCQTLSASMTTIAQAQLARSVSMVRATGAWQAAAMERQRELVWGGVATAAQEAESLAGTMTGRVGLGPSVPGRMPG